MRAALIIKQHQDLQFLLHQRAMAALSIDVDSSWKDAAGRTSDPTCHPDGAACLRRWLKSRLGDPEHPE
jgi:hypothetical protein